VDVSDAASEGGVGSNRAVVGALSSRVSIVGPAEGMAGKFGRGGNQCVLLLDSVPGLLSEVGVPDLVSEVSEVGVGGDELLVGGVFPHHGLTEDHNVVALSERISVVGDRLEVNLRVFGGGHVAGRAIEIPHGNISERVDLFVEGAALSAKGDARSVKPDVLSDDLTTLVDAEGVLVLTLKVSIFEVAHSLC